MFKRFFVVLSIFLFLAGPLFAGDKIITITTTAGTIEIIVDEAEWKNITAQQEELLLKKYQLEFSVCEKMGIVPPMDGNRYDFRSENISADQEAIRMITRGEDVSDIKIMRSLFKDETSFIQFSGSLEKGHKEITEQVKYFYGSDSEMISKIENGINIIELSYKDRLKYNGQMDPELADGLITEMARMAPEKGTDVRSGYTMPIDLVVIRGNRLVEMCTNRPLLIEQLMIYQLNTIYRYFFEHHDLVELEKLQQQFDGLDIELQSYLSERASVDLENNPRFDINTDMLTYTKHDKPGSFFGELPSAYNDNDVFNPREMEGQGSMDDLSDELLKLRPLEQRSNKLHFWAPIIYTSKVATPGEPQSIEITMALKDKKRAAILEEINNYLPSQDYSTTPGEAIEKFTRFIISNNVILSSREAELLFGTNGIYEYLSDDLNILFSTLAIADGLTLDNENIRKVIQNNSPSKLWGKSNISGVISSLAEVLEIRFNEDMVERLKNAEASYDLLLRSKPGSLTAAMDAFKAEENQKWDKNFDLVSEYIKEFGKTPSKGQVVVDKEGKKVNIGTWLTTQRSQYKKNYLDKEKTSRLESIPGWSWSEKIQTETNGSPESNFIKSTARYSSTSEQEMITLLSEYLPTDMRSSDINVEVRNLILYIVNDKDCVIGEQERVLLFDKGLFDYLASIGDKNAVIFLGALSASVGLSEDQNVIFTVTKHWTEMGISSSIADIGGNIDATKLELDLGIKMTATGMKRFNVGVDGIVTPTIRK